MNHQRTDFHVVPMPDSDDALLIETDTVIEALICETCGGLVGDEDLHEAWYRQHG